MSKQEPMLMESPLTNRVFVVTSYKDNGNGVFTAMRKYDVTEQFDALVLARQGYCEMKPAEWYEFPRVNYICSACDTSVYESYPNFCPNCGKKVKR